MTNNYSMAPKFPKWIIIGTVVAVVLIIFIACFNREKGLRADFENEQRVNQADFDNMYKTIAQKYQVSGEFYDQLKELTQAAVQGRSGGALAKSVTENYPNMDPALAREVMATIEGKRNQFQSHQTKLSDIKNQHDHLIGRVPGIVFLFWVQPLKLEMVTSDRTQDAFRTGKDNDVGLSRPKK